MSKRLKVAIVFGGQSTEHEISIISARSIIDHIDQSIYDPLPVYIDKQGFWHTDTQTTQPLLTCDEKALLTKSDQLTLIKSSQPHKLASFNEELVDVVFPVVHGVAGEDGSIQGLLETLGLPYVGADVLGSAIGMDKEVAKRLAIDANIATSDYIALNQTQWLNDPQSWLQHIEQALAFPVFIKPAQSGSSIGINKAKNPSQLQQAIDEALHYHHKIIIEKAINGRELEISVLQPLDPTHELLVSQPGEILLKHEFYSYEVKYLDQDGVQLIVPAQLTQQQIAQAQLVAKNIFKALDCQSMARIDLFWDYDQRCFLFNELNTIPGFTSISMYPKLLAHIGIDYTQLITHLLKLAILRSQG